KFVSAMRAQRELELEEERIDVAFIEELGGLEEIVVVLKPQFREFGQEPGEGGGEPPPTLPKGIIGERRIAHVQVIAAQAGRPSIPKPPDNLRIRSPVVESLPMRK